MGGSAIRRDLTGEEKAMVTFEVYGELKGPARDTFNAEFKRLIERKGVVVTCEIWDKSPGDP